jgi:hypothetical protein
MKGWLIACLTASLTWNLLGQAESGTVVGVVTDQSGAVVLGATCNALNEGTRLNRSVTSK